MGIFDRVLSIFGKKAQPKALQAEIQSPQSAIESQFNQSIKEEFNKDMSIVKTRPEPPIELQKESLQLGIAAGYTGKSLKEIELSLARIESQIITKDWFSLQFREQLLELIEITKRHEENEQERFNAMQTSLNSLRGVSQGAPEPLKTQLFTHIKAVESQLPLTSKMQDLLDIAKELKEVSYTNLAEKLGISESALRSLLTLTTRRTNKIERFKKNGRGFIRYLSDSSDNKAI